MHLFHRLAAAVLGGALLTAASTAQSSVNILASADNTLYETIFGDASNGAGSGLFVGSNSFGSIRRALLKFNVGAVVPAGSRILTARLTMTVTQTTVALPMPLNGHRVTSSWGEGTSLGDFVATPSWTASMPISGSFTSALSRQAATDVQSWLDNPSGNFGWLLRMPSETLASTAHRLNSREATSNKPTLVVTYLAPGQLGSYGTGCPTGGNNTATAAYSGSSAGGSTLTINKTNTIANSIGADYFTLSLDPVGVTLAPSCNVYLPIAEVLSGGAFLTNGTGAGSTTLVVPAGFPGYLINCQAAVLANNALGFVLTNSALCVTQ